MDSEAPGGVDDVIPVEGMTVGVGQLGVQTVKNRFPGPGFGFVRQNLSQDLGMEELIPVRPGPAPDFGQHPFPGGLISFW